MHYFIEAEWNKFLNTNKPACTYKQWLDFAIYLFKATNFQAEIVNARLENLILLEHVTKETRVNILAFDEKLLSEQQIIELLELLKRRLSNEPIAYITGKKEFWSLTLQVSNKTLIPRPETEILVEIALEKAKHLLQTQKNLSVLDLGTGTGSIVLAIASELTRRYPEKKLDFLGIDFLSEIVELAKKNALKNNLSQVNFMQSNWFDNLGIQQKFDIIVSNPPYIDPADQHLSQGDVIFEPKTALVAKNKGYADLFYIIKQAPQFLKPNGYLILEHGYQQASNIQKKFQQSSFWQDIITMQDYSKKDRITVAKYGVLSI